MDFTDVLHPAKRHGSLHLRGEANWKKRREMRKETAPTKDAAQTPDEAGATPPSDARCVPGPCGVAPALWRKALAPMVRAAKKDSRL